MVYVATDCHLQRTRQGFEYALNLVVFVVAFCLDIQVHFCSIGETLEEV